MSMSKTKVLNITGTIIALALYSGCAMAAMPWEKPICALATSLSTTTATALAVIAIVFCGLSLAFGEMGSIFKTAMGLVMGICMAVLAVTWLPALTGVNFNCPNSGLGLNVTATAYV